jgi:hypothetical protein
MSSDAQARLLDLLVERATQGLDPEGQRELDRLRRLHPDLDDESLELTIATLDLAWGEAVDEPLPAGLVQRLATEGERLIAARPTAGAPPPPIPLPRPDSRGRLGWWAAAACLLLALWGWWPQWRETREAALSPAEARAALLAQADDVLNLPWQPTDDPDGRATSGDLVWSPARQQGFMRLAGLPANDPARRQYQLWIFDRTRDEARPVDGGVFDVPTASGEVVIPIDAKLAVAEPYLFAVTVERPGGVVVSEREHIVALAQVP